MVQIIFFGDKIHASCLADRSCTAKSRESDSLMVRSCRCHIWMAPQQPKAFLRSTIEKFSHIFHSASDMQSLNRCIHLSRAAFVTSPFASLTFGNPQSKWVKTQTRQPPWEIILGGIRRRWALGCVSRRKQGCGCHATLNPNFSFS